MLRRIAHHIKQAIIVQRKLLSIDWKKKTIFLISHEIQTSGASILLRNMICEMDKIGYNAILAVYNKGIAPDVEEIKKYPKGCQIFFIRPETTLFDYLLNCLKKHNISKCIANTVISGSYLEKLAKHRFDVTILIHEMEASCQILKATQMAHNVCTLANRVVFPNADVYESFLRYAQRKCDHDVIILPQGLYKFNEEIKKEVYASERCDQEKIYLTGAGAINFGKGIDILILALVELRKRHPDKEFHVNWMGNVQDERYYCWMNAQINTAGINNYWHWKGYIDDSETFIRLIKESDVFVLPSREDSFPSVLLEAASLCVPLLAFKGSGGGTEIVMQQHGIVAEASDLNDFCNKIEYLVYHKKSVTELCVPFSDTVRKKYDFRNYVAEVLRICNMEE